MLKITCPGCAKTINAPPKYAGQTVPCPGCKSPIPIPSQDTPPPLSKASDSFDDMIADEVQAAPTTATMPPYEEDVRERMETAPYEYDDRKSANKKSKAERTEKKYAGLRIVAVIYCLLGALALMASIALFVFAAQNEESPILAISVALGSLPLFAIGGVIPVLIDIEANTRNNQ